MINSSPVEYAGIRFCIVALSAVTPISIVCTLASVLTLLLADTHFLCALVSHIPRPLHVYFFAETIFYFAFYLPYIRRLQKAAEHPPLLSQRDRRILFERVTQDCNAEELERHLRGWFRHAEITDIGRDGMKDWLAWAFFEGRINDESPSQTITNELEEYTLQLEQILGRQFPAGYGPAKPIRLTLDPVELSHRSLLWYFCVGFVDFLTYLRLCRNGYHHHRLPLKSFFALFPFRPIALTAKQRSPVKHLTYWHRPHTAKDRLPILFVHGIGIGLYPYVPYLHDLINHVDDGHQARPEDGQVGIIALEIMSVSFRITHDALSKGVMCEEIRTILHHHGWDRFVLVAHSYGTVVATHLLHDSLSQDKISAVLLIDPVCFLLHHPDVAYNFTARPPQQANEWQLWYFASQDPGVAHTLGRRFFWSENVLWLEDLRRLMTEKGIEFTISLAGRDLIVNTETVGRYLTGATREKNSGSWDDSWKGNERKEGANHDSLPDVIWNEDRDHAQVFDAMGSNRRELVKVVRKYCRKT
jgi:pimeloyl-ACP methyl ester carboxylesterase